MVIVDEKRYLGGHFLLEPRLMAWKGERREVDQIEAQDRREAGKDDLIKK